MLLLPKLGVGCFVANSGGYLSVNRISLLIYLALNPYYSERRSSENHVWKFKATDLRTWNEQREISDKNKLENHPETLKRITCTYGKWDNVNWIFLLRFILDKDFFLYRATFLDSLKFNKARYLFSKHIVLYWKGFGISATTEGIRLRFSDFSGIRRKLFVHVSAITARRR